MQATDRRQRFRSYLSSPQCIQPASVFDAVSARIADVLGFEIGMLAGSVASAVTLAAPDMTMLTLTELADLAHRITRASDLSLIVDADHGYGNALNVMRTVEELETAEVSALTIEDTMLPVSFAQSGTTQFLSIREMLGKINAAQKARKDSSLVIIGRTGSIPSEGLTAGVTRVRAYTEAGVDAIFLTGINSIQELEVVHSSTELPLILGNPPPALTDPNTLAKLGVRVVIKGHLTFQVAVQAIYDTLIDQKQNTTLESMPKVKGRNDLIANVLRDEEYDQFLKLFMGFN
jgi:carboxyvinyl-carboxyphosphonate phosphorylmutase